MSTREQERSLIPVLVVTSLVAAPLLVIIGIVLGSQIQLSNALTSDSLSSWVSAASTVAIAILTFVLAKETWYLRLAQIEQVNELRRENIRPNVAIDLKSSPISISFMNIEISNLGKGIARNIRFNFFDKNRNIINKSEDPVVDELLNLHVLSEGMHTLGIGQKVSSFVFGFPEISGKIKNGDVFSPFFTIEVSFEDVEGTQYTNEITIDFAELKGITDIGGGDSLHNISNDLKKMREKFEQIINHSSKRIHINVYDSEDRALEEKRRQEWLAEQRKSAEERKVGLDNGIV